MNLNYNISTITKAINGKCNAIKNDIIKTVFIDSRIYFDEKTAIFFAIKGNQHDAHHYIKELYDKGLRNFVVDQDFNIPNIEEATLIKVTNTLEALQKLAFFHKQQFNIPTIAITGSNGKTIIKEWLYHYLRDDYNIVRSPKSYNSQVGVPLSIFQINKEHTLGIFEAGISMPGEMKLLAKIINPTHGILSNIGTSHLENFNSIKDLIEEKNQLFNKLNWMQNFELNNNEQYFNQQTVQIHTIIFNEANTSFTVTKNEKDYLFTLPFIDQASLDNALTCIHFLIKFGLNIKTILEKTKTLPSIAFRLETQHGVNNNTIIKDNYNSNITALTIALDYLKRFNNQEKVVILTDILQDQIHTENLYKQLAELINERVITHFIGIGVNLVQYKKLFKKGSFYITVDDFLAQSDIKNIKNSCILLKGSKSYRLDKINSLLIHKTHQTSLEINLTALSNNIKYYKQKLSNNTKLMAMVKAFGYGAGYKEIAVVIQHSKVDYLGVAYTDEGVELRKQKISLPIVVMNMEDYSFEDIITYQLEPSIYSIDQLEQFIKFLIEQKILSYPIHLKIDTGMYRLGFLENEIQYLVDTIINQPEVYVKGIFSHLAAADDIKEDDFTNKQIKLFYKISNKIEASIGYEPIKNILNSSGIERFKSHELDMVRLGVGMYGISSKENLETVSTLKTKISQIKLVKANSSIGYGRSEYVTEDTLIGIIPIGYADGFNRSLSNGKGTVWIKGKYIPVIGRISMDMTMINLSTLIDVKVGEEVEIFGKNRPIEELAKQLNTIPYEVLTSVSARVVRTYIEE
jgi:alanine racemase